MFSIDIDPDSLNVTVGDDEVTFNLIAVNLPESESVEWALDPSGAEGGATITSQTNTSVTIDPGTKGGEYTVTAQVLGKTATAELSVNVILTVENGTGGGTFSPGDVVTINGTPPVPEGSGGVVNPEGPPFGFWTSNVSGGTFDDIYSEETTYTMPDQSVTVTAIYIPEPEMTPEMKLSLSASPPQPITGSSYRKIALNGFPLSDQKPQS
ncbi:MAG: hypothetical protein PF795_12425, partial [Kiritimatiellae bacterium]|nr:hypothetical protein [Kiritimatiellia bacterium]